MESAAAKEFADINGVRQGMFVQCRDPGRPVLLCVHGGMPEFFLTERYPTGLENEFTVVWWEQRGMGLSFSTGIPPATMTTEQFIADTHALTRYLRARFGREKIYLMAHSGGTFFALQAAARAPELYAAYVGVAQAVRQLESERLAQEYMVAQFKRLGDRRMVRKLASAPVTASGGTPRAYLKVRDRAMHRLGVGTTREMTSVLTGVIWPSVTCSAYTPAEKVRLWRGKLANGVSALWDDMLATDLAERVPELSLPAYFLHGIHDYTVSYQLARQYEAGLVAPLKGFYTFSDSAHSPVFEEPEKAREILRDDVLAGTNALADGHRIRTSVTACRAPSASREHTST
jgi:pimeloyl-ACP methyl ester carboxylesterase